jgi:hypothetical protein
VIISDNDGGVFVYGTGGTIVKTSTLLSSQARGPFYDCRTGWLSSTLNFQG